jgi:hypothetical protein
VVPRLGAQFVPQAADAELWCNFTSVRVFCSHRRIGQLGRFENRAYLLLKLEWRS